MEMQFEALKNQTNSAISPDPEQKNSVTPTQYIDVLSTSLMGVQTSLPSNKTQDDPTVNLSQFTQVKINFA